MQINRRFFMKILGAAGATLLGSPAAAPARSLKAPPDACGCLVDLTRCIYLGPDEKALEPQPRGNAGGERP